MFTIGFAYYPLFACMATNYKITGYVIGVLYSAFWWEIFVYYMLIVSFAAIFADVAQRLSTLPCVGWHSKK